MSSSIPEDLPKKYNETGIVLFLGAGVSIGSGLPDWTGLLSRIYQRIRDTSPGAPSLEEVLSNFSMTAFGGLLEGLCLPKSNFCKIVRECLYQDFRYNGIDIRRLRDPSKFIDFIHEGNPTLRSIAAMTAERRGEEFKANPRLRGIVNFNLDSVFRAFVNTKYGSVLRTVERPSAEPTIGKVNTYYPHGFLDFNTRNAGNLKKEAPDRLVLTEGRYFDFFNRPTEMFTYTLLFFLREYTCVFVGMSLQDDNLRRLLHYSRRELSESYRIEGHKEPKAERRGIRHYAILLANKNKRLDNWRKTSLNSLGVKPIWVGSYEEIPLVFESIYNSGGAHWKHVW